MNKMIRIREREENIYVQEKKNCQKFTEEKLDEHHVTCLIFCK